MVDGNGKCEELPEGWKLGRFQDIVKSFKRGPFGSAIKKEFFLPDGYKVYEQQNAIYDDPNRGSYFIGEDKYAQLEGFQIEPQNFIVSCSGTIGKISRLPKDAKPGVINQALLKIELDEDLFDPDLFLFLFRSNFFQKLVQIETRGSAMKNIAGVKDLKEIPIKIPPLPEQRKIVEKIEELFSDLDAGIESLKKAQQQLKIYRQAVLKWAFEGKLTEGWRQQAKAQGIALKTGAELLADIKAEREKHYHQQVAEWEAAIAQWEENGRSGKKPTKPKEPQDFSPLIDKELIDIPELPLGWVWIRFGEVLDNIEAGKSFKCEEIPPKNDEVGVAKVSAVTWGEYKELESKTCTEEERINESFLIKAGDFLFSRANTIELIGACVIVKKTNLSVMLSDKTLRFGFLDKFNQRFILYFLRSRYGRNEIERLSTGNQESMRNIGQERIRKIRISMPSFEEQDQVVQEIESRLSICDQLEATINENLKRAESLRQSILKRAFEGKLVPQDPNDEPAEKLLERIQQERQENRASALQPTAKRTSKNTGKRTPKAKVNVNVSEQLPIEGLGG